MLACAIVTPPLAPWESHTLSLPILSGLRSARLGVRLFVRLAALSRCPLPTACVSALFGVFHQHISCLSLSDENYVDDVGAALPLLTLTLSLSVASSVCVSLCVRFARRHLSIPTASPLC